MYRDCKPENLLINSEAIGQDIVGTYVVVVDENEISNYRYIEIGPEVGRMTVIEKGLSTADRVVISGQHNAPPGAKVNSREKTAESMRPPTPAASQTPDTGGQGD